MAFFGKKSEKVVDWSEGYKSSSSFRKNQKAESRSDDDNIGFLGNLANSGASTSSDISWDNESPPETVGEYQNKKGKLAKRLLEMTDKIEDLSNQIYHLKQRIELLEKKMKINFS